jgi:hypothetical protein
VPDDESRRLSLRGVVLDNPELCVFPLDSKSCLTTRTRVKTPDF